MGISKEQLKERLLETGTVVLNVLSAVDFNKTHIKGSLNEPLGQDYGAFAQGVEKRYGKQRHFVTYGAGAVCAAGPNAAKILRDHGFTVEDYEGGLEDWRRAGWPTSGNLAET
jgi:rhodanese-related sulfurtransferase